MTELNLFLCGLKLLTVFAGGTLFGGLLIIIRQVLRQRS